MRYAFGSVRRMRRYRSSDGCYAARWDGCAIHDGLSHACRQSVAVNCCSEDPHSRQLVTLGDDNMVQVFNRHTSGQWAAHRQMRVDSSDRSNACGMSCTWHPWGHLFATAFQCGQLLIWDARCCQVRCRSPPTCTACAHSCI